MALPNRMHHGYYPNNPGQSPPIFDRRQIQQPVQTGQIPGGQLPARPVPGGGGGYQGYGIGNMFQRMGNQFDVGSSVPTGGFGFDAQQKAALAPLLQQLPGLINNQPGRNQGSGQNVMGPHGGFDASGGILKALQSLGVDTGNIQGFGIGGDQRQQFLHSLQDFVTGIANRPPNRRPSGHFPGEDSPGHGGHRPPQPPDDWPPYAYSPGYHHPGTPRY